MQELVEAVEQLSTVQEGSVKKIVDIIQGKYLIAINRCLNMITLGMSEEPLTLFGEDAEKKWKIAYDFHISSIWRFSKDNKILSGYQDCYTEVDENGEIVTEEEDEEEYEEETEEDRFVRKRTLFEYRIFGEIYPVLPLRILKVSQNEMGDLRLDLEKGYCFETFSTNPIEDEMEEWRLIEVASKKHYICPEENVKTILLVDEDNTDLSQLLELLIREIIVDQNGFIIESVGIHPGETLSERVLEMGRVRYGVSLNETQKILLLTQAGFYDYVIPLGVALQEDVDESAEKILDYQDYETTRQETLEELLQMAKKICTEVGCDVNIDEEQRERMKGNLEIQIRMNQLVNRFYEAED